MRALRDTQPDAGGEVQLTHALREVFAHSGRMLAAPLAAGRPRQDVGSLEGYCAPFLEYMLRDPHFGESRGARATQLLDG
jgi:UTP-glucose-1-phosphate uridylyltransferase